MLGCHEFCGYYDFSFRFFQRIWGSEALKRLLADPDFIADYVTAAHRDGLRGLYRAWGNVGVQEQCDWTFTLDEARNVLRWDMRQCPSKGFLLEHDLNASEDYCDHCMGWVLPMLRASGMELIAHQHNHCGQCWAEMRVNGKSYEPLDLEIDIRKDPRWRRGYIDTWADGARQPLLPNVDDSSDPCQVIRAWFKPFDAIRVVSASGGPAAGAAEQNRRTAIVMTDETYATEPRQRDRVAAVLIGSDPARLDKVARRYLETSRQERPLLLCAYWPSAEPPDLAAKGLPRALPVLPILIRENLYQHVPGASHPDGDRLLRLLAQALRPVVGG